MKPLGKKEKLKNKVIKMIYTWHYGSFYTKEYFCKGNKCLLGTNRLEAARL